MAEPFTVRWLPNRTSFPVLAESQRCYLLLSLLPTKQEKRRQSRPPLNLSLALDRSSSMAGEKIYKLQQAVVSLIDALGPEDCLAITIFNDKASLLVESQILRDKDACKKRVSQLSAVGETAMSKGLEMSLAQAEKHAATGRLSRILVLTDGCTLGDEERCLSLASLAGEKNTPLVALGLGEDWNRDLLLGMAKNSRGKAEYVSGPGAITQIFTEEVKELQTVVVHNIHIMAMLSSGVALLKAYKVLPRIEEMGFSVLSRGEVSLLIGELGQDTGQALLLEYSLPASSPPSRPLCQLAITYDLPEGKLFGQKTAIVLAVDVSNRPGDNYSEEVAEVLHRVGISRLTARAVRDAETGKLAEASQKLKDVATRLAGMGETTLAQTALLAVKSLEAGHPPSAGNTMSLVFGTRKLTSALTALNPGALGASAKGVEV